LATPEVVAEAAAVGVVAVRRLVRFDLDGDLEALRPTDPDRNMRALDLDRVAVDLGDPASDKACVRGTGG
jgi:hypothetical protein